MMTTDEARLERLTKECAWYRGFGYTDPDDLRLPFPLEDMEWLLAQSAALRDQLARAEAVVQAARAVESQYRRLMGANEMLELLNLIRVPLRSALEAHDTALAARTPTPGAAGEVG